METLSPTLKRWAGYVFILLVSSLILLSIQNSSFSSSTIFLSPTTSSSTSPSPPRAATQQLSTMGDDGVPNFYNDVTSTYDCRNKYSTFGSHPRFLVLGVHKGGSTALYSYLTLHGRIRPAVCKEIHFFDVPSEFVKGKGYYLKNFLPLSQYQGKVITGEGSPNYIRVPEVPLRVLSMLQNSSSKMRFLVSLREPSTRFESHWVGGREGNRIHEGCANFWESSLKELQACYASNDFDAKCEEELHENAIVRGIYVSQLERWLKVFPREHFYILQSEFMSRNTAETMQRVVSFLGIRAYTNEELQSFQTANSGSSHMAQPLAQKCSPELKQRMDAFYALHNQRLKVLLEEHFPEALRYWVPEAWAGWMS